jgi:hypothetical protein
MSFEAYRELGFEQILCVEGVTDILPVQVFLRKLKLGLDHKIVSISLGGGEFIVAGRQPELAELKRISDKVAVLIDSEKNANGAALDGQRAAFVQTCNTLGYNIHVTDRRALEHYLTDAAIKTEKGANYRALNPYEDFKALNPKWGKDENWRIAQHMTKEELLATDLGEWLSKL